MTLSHPLIPPPRRAALTELRAVREPFRLAAATRRLRSTSAISRIVVTVPGYGATDSSMAPLRGYLRRIGHRPEGWGFGRNDGQVERLYPDLGLQVRRIADAAGETVDLVGWSLGGVLAREVARDHPDAVGQVITYGTPVVGGPRYTRAARVFSDARKDEIEAMIELREQIPIPVPVTAIFSRKDGVVAWQACLDPFGNAVDHVEVESSHLGMGLDPDVWRAVADRISVWTEQAA